MKKLSNHKWMIISVITIIFLVISTYRYQIVNKPYKDYNVIENIVNVNQPIEVDGFKMTFGLPRLIEGAEKYILEVPLLVTNTTSEVSRLSYEDFMVTFNKYSTNGIGYIEISNHPENQIETFAFDGISPGEEGHAYLIFNLMKDWRVNEQTDINLYYTTFSDNLDKKYKLPYKFIDISTNS